MFASLSLKPEVVARQHLYIWATSISENFAVYEFDIDIQCGPGSNIIHLVEEEKDIRYVDKHQLGINEDYFVTVI